MNDIGQIEFYDEIEDGIGSRTSREFLKQLFVDFSKKCRTYFDVTGDLPYIYREQQIHSVLVPVIDNIADAILVECPTNRKDRGYDPSHGWIDYWVKYGNTIFLIELKHSYNGLKSNGFKEKSKEEWKTANKQLKQIPKKDIDDFKINKKNNVVKIALQFNTTYTTAKDNNFSFTECENIGKKIMRSLDVNLLKPNFIAHWHIHKDMQVEYNYTNGTEKYPYVHMLAKL